MDTLLDLLIRHYPKVLGNLILKYYYNGNEKDIYNIFKQGTIALIDIDKLSKYELNRGLFGACSGGYIRIVKLMIEKGANNFDWGLYYACRNSHMEIVKLMIEKGANEFNWGLAGACTSGHLQSKAFRCQRHAVGHMEIVKLMIEKGADDLNWGLDFACHYSNMEMIKLMIEKGATKCDNCNNTKHPELLS